MFNINSSILSISLNSVLGSKEVKNENQQQQQYSNSFSLFQTRKQATPKSLAQSKTFEVYLYLVLD